MRESDQQLGKPLRAYRDTKANIVGLGLGAADEGCIAYANDVDDFGTFDGANWTWLAAPPAVAGYALVSDGVDTWIADQTPAWTGEHSFGAGIAFTGASGANEITVPDNTAIALELLDAGGLEYMRVVSTDANPYLLIDPAATGFLVGVGIAAPVAHLDVYDATVNTTATYYGGRFDHAKTAGVTDTVDNLCGLMGNMRLNQVGGVVGYVDGLSGQATIAVGEIGQSGTLRHLRGLICNATHTGGTTWGDVMGAHLAVDANAGTIGQDVYGCNITVDIEAAITSIGQNVYGLRVWMDVDQDPVGTVYGIHLTEGSNQDYGFYQSGSADNYFGGSVGIGTATIPHGGVGYAKFAIEGTNASAAGPHVQLTTASDDYPLLQIIAWQHDDISLVFDAYYDGANRSSDAGSNACIQKAGDTLTFKYDSGIAQGAAVTWNDGLIMDLTNGYFGLGTTPAYKLDAKDDRAGTYMARFWNDGDNLNRYGIRIQCGADDGATVGTTYVLRADDGDGGVFGYLKTTNGVFSLANVSDEHRKTNIKDTRLKGLDIINELQVRDFNWKANPNGPVMTSFVAQEAQKIFPDMVSEGDDGLLVTSRAVLIPILTKAIQELDARLTHLEAK